LALAIIWLDREKGIREQLVMNDAPIKWPLPVWDIQVVVSFHIQATDDLKAQEVVLRLVENHLADMLDCPAVVETHLRMAPDNPKTIGRIG
jgi:hypothetical protein